MYGTFIDSALIVLANQGIWYGLALFKRDNSFADMAWATGLMGVAFHSWRHNPTTVTRTLFFMALAWGVRLLTLLAVRYNGVEDWRYAKMRAKAGGPEWWTSLSQVFLTQGAIQYAISMLFQWAAVGSVSASSLFYKAGIAVWAVGLLYESLADWQLWKFRRIPANKGRTYSRGLWAFSRHPNYFGEMLVWWGMFLSTLPSPTALVTVFAPLIVTGLLLKVSGVNLIEQKLAERSDYKEYQRRAPSSVVPHIPTKSAATA